MFKFLLMLAICILVGCATTGVKHSEEAYKKVVKAYVMMNQGRPIPAERLAQEAFETFEEQGDVFGQGEALVALGLLYKSPLLPDYAQSVARLQQAVALFASIDDYASLAKSKFALGNAFAVAGQKSAQCALYGESLQDYAEAKQRNPDAAFQFNTAYPSFDAMVKDFQAKYCA